MNDSQLDERLAAAMRRAEDPPSEEEWVALRALAYREMYRQRYTGPAGLLEHFEEMGYEPQANMALGRSLGSLTEVDWEVGRMLNEVYAGTAAGERRWDGFLVRLRAEHPLRLEALQHAVFETLGDVPLSPVASRRWFLVHCAMTDVRRLWGASPPVTAWAPAATDDGGPDLATTLVEWVEGKDPAVQARFINDVLDICQEVAA